MRELTVEHVRLSHRALHPTHDVGLAIARQPVSDVGLERVHLQA